ncbi:MAG: hypothetical protein JRM80_00320 [Nitrososphaerota archaeon]|nr:hypothetical protein [Nitrososphaerota archaeon]
MLGTFLSNVSLGTADFLSYLMLVVVAIFLLSGPVITYYYWRRNKKMKATPSAGSGQASP